MDGQNNHLERERERQYYNMQIQQMQYVSTLPRLDGFGAQFQNIIFDILFTHVMTPAMQYVFPSNVIHMKFEHNYGNDPTFSDRLIRLMNLNTHFNFKTETATTTATATATATATTTVKRSVTFYNGVKNYAFCETNLTRLLETTGFKSMQQLFFEGKRTPHDAEFYNVAVHVRKYSASDMRIHRRMNEPTSYYVNVMRFITAGYKGTKPIRFHIYSQGNVVEFAEFAAFANNAKVEVVMHLDESVEDTFNGLVFADALVTSASSFSYVAAILTHGTVFYKKFWHKPSMKWIVGDDLPPNNANTNVMK